MKRLFQFFSRSASSAPDPQVASAAAASGTGSASSHAASSAAGSLDELIARGNQLEDAGDWDGAAIAYQRAVQSYPDSPRAWVNAGNLQSLRGNLEQACATFARAVAMAPDYAPARLNLGNTQLAIGRPAEAEAEYRAALQIKPGWTAALAGLGCALEERGAVDAAIETYREALRGDPDDSGAARNLARLLADAGDGSQAYRVLEDALGRHPADADLEKQLAQLDRNLMRPAHAVARYRRVLANAPGDFRTWSDLLFTLNFVPSMTAAELLEEHRRYGASLARGLTPIARRSPAEPERRLRIGYVSPDFRRHPVACFIEPLLRCHDPGRFDVYCYYTHEDHDEITARLAAHAHVWRDSAALTDEALARRIDADGIDILVDLAGHTGGNRLGTFARKPAPVQLTWLGYLATTGLAAIDYRLCDACTDPPGVAEAWQTESPLRLPDSQWCYQPQVDVPAASSTLPFEANGFWTFGSFNQPSKLNEPVLEAWSRVLAAVPGSRLRMVGLSDRSLRTRIGEFLQQRGIAAERLDMLGRVPIAEYLAAHRGVDVALDTFPYNGGTTTCDALLMGVPVASVAGDRSVARSGVSLLGNVGLHDWLAPDAASLPACIQAQLAQPPRMAELRRTLPARMRQSPLMDAERFARNVEQALRAAWQRACAG
jgi:protein O-GlcNAc transferase